MSLPSERLAQARADLAAGRCWRAMEAVTATLESLPSELRLEGLLVLLEANRELGQPQEGLYQQARALCQSPEEVCQVLEQALEPDLELYRRLAHRPHQQAFGLGQLARRRQPSEAVELLQRALRLDADSPQAADLLGRLGEACRACGRAPESEASLRAALALASRHLGEEHPRLAVHLYRLAHSGYAPPEETVAHLHRAVTLQSRALELRHPLFAGGFTGAAFLRMSGLTAWAPGLREAADPRAWELLAIHACLGERQPEQGLAWLRKAELRLEGEALGTNLAAQARILSYYLTRYAAAAIVMERAASLEPGGFQASYLDYLRGQADNQARQQADERALLVQATSHQAAWQQAARRLSGDGLRCPHCAQASQHHRAVEARPGRKSYFVCAGCGRSFFLDDLSSTDLDAKGP